MEFSGYSRRGGIFILYGAQIKTLGKPVLSALKGIDIYIIVDPDTTTEFRSLSYILKYDIKEIKKWIKKGGTLAILANDTKNCEFTNLNKLKLKNQ